MKACFQLAAPKTGLFSSLISSENNRMVIVLRSNDGNISLITTRSLGVAVKP